MANNKYKGSLRLDWINKDLSLYYEIDEEEGKGVRPVWVPKNDIRVAEPRILRFEKSYGEPLSENMLVKGDNLLVLRSLVEMFKGRPEKERVKCIYIDPPFNTGSAFEKYDDNLQHSEWLTMMRDRLYVLNKLLRKDGLIFVHLDETEMAYAKVLLDEIIGRINYCNTICMTTNDPSGFKATSATIFSTANYLLVYAKDKTKKPIKKFYTVKAYDSAYNKVLLNKDEHFKKWKYDNINNIVSKQLGYDTPRKAKSKLGEVFLRNIAQYAIEHADIVFRTAAIGGGAAIKRDETIRKSIGDHDKVYMHPDEDLPEFYILNGEQILFYNKRLTTINGRLQPGEIVTDVWTDLSWTGIAAEGGVVFKNGKKPEQLIKRVLDIATEKGDIVLDSFAGSGTTGAVAHKMDRRWIMVELGKQAEELIKPRMARILNGKDKTGISTELNWQGGGGYKYYRLGDSIINEKDMNWTLKAPEMAEAIFLHFQYKPHKADILEKEDVYLGKHRNARYHYAISFATREIKVITEELYENIIEYLEQLKFRHLTIFTNVALAVPANVIDDRIFVKKIPAAILREYNLL